MCICLQNTSNLPLNFFFIFLLRFLSKLMIFYLWRVYESLPPTDLVPSIVKTKKYKCLMNAWALTKLSLLNNFLSPQMKKIEVQMSNLEQ